MFLQLKNIKKTNSVTEFGKGLKLGGALGTLGEGCGCTCEGCGAGINVHKNHLEPYCKSQYFYSKNKGLSKKKLIMYRYSQHWLIKYMCIINKSIPKNTLSTPSLLNFPFLQPLVSTDSADSIVLFFFFFQIVIELESDSMVAFPNWHLSLGHVHFSLL